MRNTRRQFKNTLPWNPWVEQKGTVYGSLESLSRSKQGQPPVGPQKFFNGWVFLSVFGGGAVTVLLVLGMIAMIAVKWSDFSGQELSHSREANLNRISALSVDKRSDHIQGQETISEVDFEEVKGKMHQFFTKASSNEGPEPLVISERELNAILKHDRRLGALHNTVSARIQNGRILTSFDIKLGRISMLGNQDARLNGIGSFRIGMYGNQLKVAVDSLKVNNSSLYQWMQYAHNMGIADLAKSSLKSVANVPLRLLGKEGFRTRNTSKSVSAIFNISNGSTGDVFKSMNYKGDGALNWLAEPVQLYTLNELFDVHSRLRDLVKSLERVEVTDKVIKLYPRRS